MSLVAIITPSNHCPKKEINQAKKNLKKLEFTEILDFTSSKKFLDRWAGSPKERLKLFQKALKSKSKTVFACRGGSGVFHFIFKLDFNEIKKTNKTFAGYSDLTPLLNSVYQKSGLIALHSPMPTKNLDKKSLQALKDALKRKNYGINFSKKHIINLPNKKIIQEKIMGGNLERIRDLVVSPLKINFNNKIIFIEEVDKTEQGIFNLLITLKQSGLFKPKALLIGHLNINNKRLIIKMLKHLFPKIPIILDLPFGHTLPNITIPIGAKTTINFKKGKILFSFP